MSRKINTKDLVHKIEKLTKERMSQADVVDMNDLRRLRDKKIRRTVLMIEDDDTIRAAIKRMLEGEGYGVLAAADGSELTSVLSDSAIDLIILDVMLPDVDGWRIVDQRLRTGRDDEGQR